jgi:hypothetical protein
MVKEQLASPFKINLAPSPSPHCILSDSAVKSGNSMLFPVVAIQKRFKLKVTTQGNHKGVQPTTFQPKVF